MLFSTIVTVSQINKIHIEMFMKLVIYFIGLLVSYKNVQKYLVWFIFIKLLFNFFLKQCLF